MSVTPTLSWERSDPDGDSIFYSRITEPLKANTTYYWKVDSGGYLAIYDRGGMTSVYTQGTSSVKGNLELSIGWVTTNPVVVNGKFVVRERLFCVSIRPMEASCGAYRSRGPTLGVPPFQKTGWSTWVRGESRKSQMENPRDRLVGRRNDPSQAWPMFQKDQYHTGVR